MSHNSSGLRPRGWPLGRARRTRHLQRDPTAWSGGTRIPRAPLRDEEATARGRFHCQDAGSMARIRSAKRSRAARQRRPLPSRTRRVPTKLARAPKCNHSKPIVDVGRKRKSECESSARALEAEKHFGRELGDFCAQRARPARTPPCNPLGTHVVSEVLPTAPL